MSTTVDPPQAGEAAAALPVADEHWPAGDDLLKLRPGVELLTGADGRSMLFDDESGKYVFLSAGACLLVPQLTTGVRYGQLTGELARRSGARAEQVDRASRPLARDLLRMGLLEGIAPDAGGVTARLARSQIKMPHVRLPLSTARADRVFAALARLFRGRAGGLALGAAGLLGLAGVLAALGAIFFTPFAPDLSAVWVVYLVMIPQTLLHETAHGVLCRRYGVPAREVGVALWFYVMPIAYVDRSDSVRLERRWPRVAILLAGPAFDGIVLGVLAVLLICGAGDPGVLGVLVAFQTVMLCMNFNPMLPTDGQQALENALGKLNLRNRAMTYVLHRLLRKPLPSALAKTARRDRALFWGYGLVCLGYLLLVFGMLGVTLYTLVGHLF
ncbi:site-2 protease family protein [Amycolatopsis sp. VS8301801F10]|uniref:site-2 protease family protein n=1 Tax=Amycolatopsis sp. VS8301801F10 TaxID=2652442 RepID=UPI0038FCFB95